MTEQDLPNEDPLDEDLTVVDDQAAFPNESIAPEPLDPVTDGEPDDYPTAAENNPEGWQQDPLLQDEPSATGGEEGALSDQTLRDETAEERYLEGAEQVPPDAPTLGEAAADVDFGDPADDSEVDSSDDAAHLGGSPLGEFDPEDLDR